MLLPRPGCGHSVALARFSRGSARLDPPPLTPPRLLPVASWVAARRPYPPVTLLLLPMAWTCAYTRMAAAVAPTAPFLTRGYLRKAIP